MDEADMTSERLETEERLARMVRRAVPEAFATGRCLQCVEPTPPDRRWCCPECRDDGDRKRTMERKLGRG